MKARIPKNVNSGGAQNMNQMIKQAQKMQDQITGFRKILKKENFPQQPAAVL